MVIIFILEHILGGTPIGMSIIGVGLGGVLFSIAALKTKGLALPLRHSFFLELWAMDSRIQEHTRHFQCG